MTTQMQRSEQSADAALPLTVIEELFFWTGQFAQVGATQFRFRFSGVIQRDPLESAVRQVGRRHPFLFCRVALRARERPFWQPDAGELPPIEWMEGALEEEDYSSPPAIDLTRSAGLRWRIRVDLVQKKSEVSLLLHHSCADAAGVEKFMEELLAAYADQVAAGGNTSTDRPDSWPVSDLESLKKRGQFGLGFWKSLRLVPGLMIGLFGVRQYLMRRPVGLGERDGILRSNPPSAAEPSTRVLTNTFDSDETALLLNAPRKIGEQFTLNDLLTRDLFLAVAASRRRESDSIETDWLRFVIPLNLRHLMPDTLPAANGFSVVFLDRQLRQTTDSACLLQGIHEEMDLIKRNKLALIFCISGWVARLFSGNLRREAEKQTRFGTVIFSNIGPVFQRTPLLQVEGRRMAGDVTLEDVLILPAQYRGLSASFSCWTYDGRLSVSLRADSDRFTVEEARQLFDDWVRRIRASWAS